MGQSKKSNKDMHGMKKELLIMNPVIEQVWHQVLGSVWRKVAIRANNQVYRQVWTQVNNQVMDQVEIQVRNQVRNQIRTYAE